LTEPCGAASRQDILRRRTATWDMLSCTWLKDGLLENNIRIGKEILPSPARKGTCTAPKAKREVVKGGENVGPRTTGKGRRCSKFIDVGPTLL